MSNLVKKDDSVYYSTEDIYDSSGLLLLRKGQKITNSTKRRLERIGNYGPERLYSPGNKQNVIPASKDIQSNVLPSGNELVGRIKTNNNPLFERTNEMLINIVFESKAEPWWIHINALSNYVDWLYTHSIDVAMISMLIAAELGYNDKELFNMGLGALLHDVGKLLIPKPILQKPEGLTDMEMALVRQHCELGTSSLGTSLPKGCMDIVMQHHERCDGKGYPNGLKGDEISRNARIVMIADAFDTLTAGRPYRTTQEINEAIMILKYDKGKYDQEFISLLEKILVE